jgi:hypothetical protein
MLSKTPVGRSRCQKAAKREKFNTFSGKVPVRKKRVMLFQKKYLFMK